MGNVNLQDAVLIDCSFTGCGGTRTIAEGKIVVEDNVIDTEGVTSKKLQWFPSEALSFKDKHNKRLSRYFEQIGIPTPLGIVIDKVRLQEAEDLIARETNQFFDAVDNVCDSYEVIIEQHAINANQKSGNERIGKIIKMVAMTKVDFRATFKVTSMPPLVLSTTSDQGAKEFSKILTDGALTRLVETASKLFNKSYQGKEKTTEAATRNTFDLKDMVYNLSFANKALVFVAEAFTDVLEGVNPNVEHDGLTFHAMRSFVSELSTEDSLTAIMEGNVATSDESDDESSDDDAKTVTAGASSASSVATTQSTPTEDEDEDKAQAPVVKPKSLSKSVKNTNPTLAITPSEDVLVDAKAQAKSVNPKKAKGFGNF
jgi:hypothetical protein